ncbi:ATP-binding protein [Kitasatospora sp. NPDC096147]|uniref:ATP-binding protein n=1 Tax=Kitasatospora sp. NPDC096147 TaxID=3364093 RepID=UPI003815049C
MRGNGELVSDRRALAVSFVGDEPVSAARRRARAFLAELEAGAGVGVSARAAQAVELVVSELVTNARKYAPGPCLLELELEPERGAEAVRISVWDSESALPMALPPDPARVGQHGLEVVLALCLRFEVQREPVGKRVTVAVSLPDDPSGSPAGRVV